MSIDSQPNNQHPLIFISAAEPSADLHAASLIRATLDQCPSARFVGVAGPRMVEAGCERIFDMSVHSAMLLGAIKAVGRGAAMMSTCDKLLRQYAFDAAVVIDSPMLHLPLAGRAHALGIPVLYYIAPQMWAWGAYRIHKLRNRTNRVAVILPFEEPYFRDQGVNATYVGHPLADQFNEKQIDPQIVHDIKNHGSPVVALLPGSRKHVVRQILADQLEVAEQIAREIPDVSFGVSVANPQVAPLITAMIASSKLSLRSYPWNHIELIESADLVLVASGTTTLEVAFHKRPMIVMYNASRVFYHLVARWMISTKYLSLPNILADREIVPEFMPFYSSTEPIALRAIELLQSEKDRRQIVQDLSEVVKPFHEGRASEKTAEMLLDMIAESSHES